MKKASERDEPLTDEIPEIEPERLRAARKDRGRYAGRIQHPRVARIFDSEAGTTLDQAQDAPLEASTAPLANR